MNSGWNWTKEMWALVNLLLNSNLKHAFLVHNLLINYVAVVAPISKNVLKATGLPTGFQEYLSQDPFIWVTWMCSLNLKI